MPEVKPQETGYTLLNEPDITPFERDLDNIFEFVPFATRTPYDKQDEESDILGRHTITVMNYTDPAPAETNYWFEFAKPDSSKEVPSLILNDNTKFHWDFRAENTYDTTIAIFGSQPVIYTLSTLETYDVRNPPADNQGILAIVNVGAPLPSDSSYKPLIKDSEVPGKRYICGHLGQFIAYRLTENSIPFTMFDDYNTIEISAIIRINQITGSASTGREEGVATPLLAFYDFSTPKYGPAIVYLAGFPGFVTINPQVTDMTISTQFDGVHPELFPIEIGQKYHIKGIFGFSETKLYVDGELVSTSPYHKYASGILEPGEINGMLLGVSSMVDIEEIMIDAHTVR